ncbi:hypothetical protein BH18ACT3_BH18ACT3_26330 [soil metagenome]
MEDIAALADRAAAGTQSFARLGARLARGVATFGVVATVICAALALFALSGQATVVALVLTVMAATLAVGSPLLAWWRLRSINDQFQTLSSEFRQLFNRDASARNHVIDTVEHGKTPNTPGSTQRRGPIGSGTRRFSAIRLFDVQQLRGLRNITAAFLTLSAFPRLLALAFLGVTALGVLTLAFGIAALL